MGEMSVPHPRESMDDLTLIAGHDELEKVNTIPFGRHLEVRAKTLVAGLCGLVIGALVGWCCAVVCGWTVGVLVCGVVTCGVPFVFVGVDRLTGMTRWKQWKHMTRSRRLEGMVVFPGSPYPVDLTHVVVHVYWRSLH